jgi:hypothetical protein
VLPVCRFKPPLLRFHSRHQSKTAQLPTSSAPCLIGGHGRDSKSSWLWHLQKAQDSGTRPFVQC